MSFHSLHHRPQAISQESPWGPQHGKAVETAFPVGELYLIVFLIIYYD